MQTVRTYEISPKPGARGWISRLDPYPLPEGLGNRWRVIILAVGPEWCAVKTENLRHWVVETKHLDCGRRYDIPGNGSRTPEDHPAVLNYLEAWLAFQREHRDTISIDHMRLASISETAWTLRRNGREPPLAQDPNQQRLEAEYERDSVKPASEALFIPFRHGVSLDGDDSPP